MATVANRALETSTTTGTGTINLAGAVTGYQTLVAALTANGGSSPWAGVRYLIEDGTDWEIGTGTVTDASPDTLARISVTESSNGGAAVNWGAGTRNVAIVAAATDLGGGKVLQQVISATGAVATGTTTIPADDTIPQNTEGTQFMTVSITPNSASSYLVIDVVASLSSTLGNVDGIVGAIYQDSTANALAATIMSIPQSGAGDMGTLVMSHRKTSGTTSSITFKFRAGPPSAATVTFNGVSGSRLFGGVANSFIRVTEISA